MRETADLVWDVLEYVVASALVFAVTFILVFIVTAWLLITLT